jgi:hypothetical protein
MDVDDSVRLFNKTVAGAAARLWGARFGRMSFGPAGFRQAPRPEDRKAPVCGRMMSIVSALTSTLAKRDAPLDGRCEVQRISELRRIARGRPFLLARSRTVGQPWRSRPLPPSRCLYNIRSREIWNSLTESSDQRARRNLRTAPVRDRPPRRFPLTGYCNAVWSGALKVTRRRCRFGPLVRFSACHSRHTSI